MKALVKPRIYGRTKLLNALNNCAVVTGTEIYSSKVVLMEKLAGNCRIQNSHLTSSCKYCFSYFGSKVFKTIVLIIYFLYLNRYVDGEVKSVNTQIGLSGFARSNKNHRKPEHKEIMSTLYRQRILSKTGDAMTTDVSSIDGSQTLDFVPTRDLRSRLNSIAAKKSEKSADASFNTCGDVDRTEFTPLLVPQSSRGTCAENLAMRGESKGIGTAFKGQQTSNSPSSFLNRANNELDLLPTQQIDKNSVGSHCISPDKLNEWTSKSTPQLTAEQSCHVVRDQPSKRDVGHLLDEKCYEDFGAGADVVAVQGTQPRPDETAVVVSFSWCKSLDAIYFRTSEMQRKLKKLENEMKEHYTNATNNTPKFDIGYRCAVFADMQWWRAEVICVDSSPGGSCEVSLVDTGYQLTVEGKNIYPLDPIFDEYPRLIMNCSLVGVYPPGAAGWDNSVSNL